MNTNLLSNINSFALAFSGNLFKKSGKFGGFLMTVAVFITMSVSCTDDLDIHIDNTEKEGFTGITLCIPDGESAAEYGATRGDEYVNTRAYDLSKEMNFNTLYIVAIEQKDDETKVMHTFFKSQPDDLDEESGYRKYNISLSPGDYKFYVVANLNRYTFDSEGREITFPQAATSEDAIRDLIINFTYNSPLEPGFLPMACLHEKLKVGTDITNAVVTGDNLITIEENASKIICADLNFLCSKVRYTILFDREKTNYGDNTIDIHRESSSNPPYVSNLRESTPLNVGKREIPDISSVGDNESGNLFVTDQNNKSATWKLPLDRYVYGNFDFYDEDKGEEDIKNALEALKAWSSTDGSWNSGDFLDKRAWQGVAYLPENLVKDAESGKTLLTVLNFPYNFNGSEGVESPRKVSLDFSHDEGVGIMRSKSYEIYALIKEPDAADMVVNTFIEDWTLQSLTYELHGPYELIVDKTSVETLSMAEPAFVWFKSDIAPQDIEFVSPQVSINNNPDDKSSMRPLFFGEVVKKEDGSYLTQDGFYQMKVTFNLEIPYRILRGLRASLDFNDQNYSKEDISFFHIVAGNLYKRIDIENLDLNPYLNVTPQTLIVDTREMYTSGYDNYSFDIQFETNVDLTDPGVTLTLTDESNLISKGMGDGDLRVTKPYYVTGSASPYNITIKENTEKTGFINLNIKNIITGNPYWNKNNEYTLKFTLTVPSLTEGEDPEVFEKEVVIKVRPFSGNYILHFRDNTKRWDEPHVYVYQDLTLPSDLTEKEPGSAGYDASKLHPYAGKIVGYIERNPSSGLQWNAAVQYVFSNNCSFRGWKGYGGPDINDPWATSTWTASNPQDAGNNSTYGFVMFGTGPDNNPVDGCWNYTYAYNYTAGLAENPIRDQRYNYDVNFNGDHQDGWDNWGCSKCKWMAPDYNDDNNQYFYPGISMEREADGWWKYTLTGVALPGRTMIIFANYHAPWDKSDKDYTAEDNRWPGDYESGLPLFDFEDNEGWFLFDGNTSNSEQKFVDDKPISQVISHTFTQAITNNIKIRMQLPTGVTVNSIEVGHQNKYTGEDKEAFDENKFDRNYYRDASYTTGWTSSGGFTEFSFSDANAQGYDNMVVKVSTNSGTKTYMLAPKNFVKSGTGYVTVKPLYWEFNDDIDLFVKWNDNIITGEYKPNGGSDSLYVDYGGNSGDRQTVTFSGKEYGNYKFVVFSARTPQNNKDRITLRLSSDSNFSKNVNVEDLPQYYNPTEEYYQINIHKIK